MASESGFLERIWRNGLAAHRYRVYAPPERRRARPRPVVLFLHGSGERGRDGLAPTLVGLGEAIRRHPERFPAVVVFPQAGERERWAGAAARRALTILDASVEEFGGDPERVSAVGLSMGGYGVLRIAAERPGRFAAVVAVCGGIVIPRGLVPSRAPRGGPGTDPYAAAAEKLAGLPVRLFHGADDPVIPASESRRLAAALSARGADVAYTEFAGVGHESWVEAFGDAALWSWLFARERVRPAGVAARGAGGSRFSSSAGGRPSRAGSSRPSRGPR